MPIEAKSGVIVFKFFGIIERALVYIIFIFKCIIYSLFKCTAVLIYKSRNPAFVDNLGIKLTVTIELARHF